MQRKRVLGVLGIAIVLVTGIAYANSKYQARHKHNREARYKSLAESYRADAKDISDRKHLEQYFQAKGLKYRKLCCVSPKHISGYDTVYDELIKVGEEDVPWYCSEHNIYIAFEFDKGPTLSTPVSVKNPSLTPKPKASAKTDSDEDCKPTPPRDDGNDVLTKISVYPMFEGCL